MKKNLMVIIIVFTTLLCFAQNKTFVNEKYELLDQQEQYESIINSIKESDESTYTATDFFYLGLAYFRLENDIEAQKYLKIAIQKAPEFSRAYYYLAGSYYYTNNFSGAIDSYLKCIELNKKDSKSYKMLGIIFEKQGDYKTALEYYSQFYKLEKSPDATYRMAYILYEMKEYKKAKPYVEEYLKTNKDSFSMTNLMILILYSNGEYKNIKIYEEQLRTIWNQTSDENIKKQAFFIIYSFSYDEYEIDVYEKFDQSEDFYYPLTCNVRLNGKVIKTVNLEYDAVTAEFGTPYLLGIDELNPKKHITTNIGFSKYPEFTEFIKYVKLAIDNKLDISASSELY